MTWSITMIAGMQYFMYTSSTLIYMWSNQQTQYVHVGADTSLDDEVRKNYTSRPNSSPYPVTVLQVIIRDPAMQIHNVLLRLIRFIYHLLQVLVTHRLIPVRGQLPSR